MNNEGDISEGRIPISCHAFKKPKNKGNSLKLGILLLCFLTMGLSSAGWGNPLESDTPEFGDEGFLESMILMQDFRLLAQAKKQKEETKKSSKEASPEENPFEEVDSKTGKSVDIEQRFPNVKTKAEPTDMLERVGGMPLEVPRELDIGRTPQMRAKLRRQQLLNRFNPALGFVFEPVFSYKNRLQTFNGGGGANARGNGDDAVGNALPGGFSAALRTIELFAAADVDTYARAYVIATGHGEAVGEAGSEEFLKASFEIEEAAIQTTSLPYNFSIRGGRFFADWGYLGRRHAHDLPQIDPPPSFSILYDRNRTDGLEVSWLSPSETYLQINAGWGFNFGQLSEDALAQRRQQINHGNNFFGVIRTYKDITDDHNVELGFSWLYGAQVRVPEAETAALLAIDSNTPIDRTTLDIDFHYRWYPLGRGLRQSLAIHGEVFYDFGQGRRDIFGNTVAQGAWGGYTYAEYRITKQWRPGFRFDYYQLPSEPALVFNAGSGQFGSTANANGSRTDVRTWSPYVTFYPSEFHRFILEYEYSSYGNATSANGVFFQWEVVIGSHQHGFTERD